MPHRPAVGGFLHAKAVATADVIQAMHHQLSSAWIDNFWRRLFPGEIPNRLLVAEPLEDNELELEGHKLVVINTGRTDTAYSTCLLVPSIGLIVGGDAVYNGIHPYLGETDTESRLEWISALDTLEALHPQAVVAGHKVPKNADDPRIIAETRQYLRDFRPRRGNISCDNPRICRGFQQTTQSAAKPGSGWWS